MKVVLQQNFSALFYQITTLSNNSFYTVKIRMLEKSNYAVLTLSVIAPDRAPHNIQWTMIGSTLSLHWDPVVAMETESKVIGYMVCANWKQMFSLQWRLVILNKHIYTFSPVSGAPEKEPLQRYHHSFYQPNCCGAHPLYQWQLSDSGQSHEWRWWRCGQRAHPHP